ncbi:peptidase M66 [Vibrio sp. S9_S30]|uniref:M66 family metalloprotease n=1 Tax=Vibrio sp. S9_S30 TaxID=2720226 RepID=UPI001681648E|nr:M66 family metalloprotease [Vibrio sp. S9_S30]MBD1559437.1 peptidase M66 [Vibrio sp. S9_S30]
MKNTVLFTAIFMAISYPAQSLEISSNFQYFNQNNFESDTQGNLPASVWLAQNVIMPSHHGVVDDVTPHLTSHRRTMVLFQPKTPIPVGGEVHVSVKNAAGETVYQGQMESPDNLPLIAGQTLFKEHIERPSQYEKTISDGTTLANFANDPKGEYFAGLLSTNNTILIKTRNGHWTQHFHLPSGEQYHGKRITFSSNAGYISSIHYTNNVRKLTYGDTLTLKNANGTWYADVDAEFNRIKYSANTYSIALPAQIIQPGLTLHFSDGQHVGDVVNLHIGAPNELLIHTIDLGLLTPPRNQFTFQSDSELHREYYQQLPIQRLTVSVYEPQHFTEIVLPNGERLTDFDPSQGGIHKGTMRQQIAQGLVSYGINNANYGISSSGGTSFLWHPYSAAQITAHNAIGRYANGVQLHGMSARDGIVSLKNSEGNELSHEFGHNFDLRHFPGGFSGAINQSAEYRNSTWGWDADLNHFLPNIEKAVTHQNKCYQDECAAPFLGHRFGSGAMSGGGPLYVHYNRYTLHTPYELNKIQAFFESKAVFSPDSPSGFRKWDAKTKTMQPWTNKIKDDLMQVSSATKAQVPYKQGVPVTTIVGYYDPDEVLNGHIYPALHGSFGAVYQDNFASSSCQLNVHTKDSGTKTFNLYARRLDANSMNKFHVNVEQALSPYSAEVYCNGHLLASLDISAPTQPLNTHITSDL